MLSTSFSFFTFDFQDTDTTHNSAFPPANLANFWSCHSFHYLRLGTPRLVLAFVLLLSENIPWDGGISPWFSVAVRHCWWLYVYSSHLKSSKGSHFYWNFLLTFQSLSVSYHVPVIKFAILPMFHISVSGPIISSETQIKVGISSLSLTLKLVVDSILSMSPWCFYLSPFFPLTVSSGACLFSFLAWITAMAFQLVPSNNFPHWSKCTVVCVTSSSKPFNHSLWPSGWRCNPSGSMLIFWPLFTLESASMQKLCLINFYTLINLI